MENSKREIRKGKVWTPKNSSRVCSAHFKDGQPTNENPDPRIWDTTSTPKLWDKRERTYWISPKLPLKRSPEKQRKAVKKFLRYWWNKKYPVTRTRVSENTATAPETTANFGNCNTAPEAGFFVNNCCPDKDLHIQELQE